MIPMALALAAGVVFATLLTLLLVPSLLVILNDLRLLIYRYRNGCWTVRENVEPARNRNKDLVNMPETEADKIECVDSSTLFQT